MGCWNQISGWKRNFSRQRYPCISKPKVSFWKSRKERLHSHQLHIDSPGKRAYYVGDDADQPRRWVNVLAWRMAGRIYVGRDQSSNERCNRGVYFFKFQNGQNSSGQLRRTRSRHCIRNIGAAHIIDSSRIEFRTDTSIESDRKLKIQEEKLVLRTPPKSQFGWFFGLKS